MECFGFLLQGSFEGRFSGVGILRRGSGGALCGRHRRQLAPHRTSERSEVALDGLRFRSLGKFRVYEVWGLEVFRFSVLVGF